MNGIFLRILVTLFLTGTTCVIVRADDGGPVSTKPAAETVDEKEASSIDARWKNGLWLSTLDESFSLRIAGNVHFDTKVYPDDDSANPAQFDIRRARMDFQGLFYRYLSFRLQAELADAPYIRNAWVDVEFRSWLHLRAGQMKPPFSTSWWTLDNNVNFIERGAGTPIYPYFDRGWWIWGDLLKGAITYNVAAFTGVGSDLDNKKGDVDDHKDVLARLFLKPFRNTDVPALAGVNFCFEASTGRQTIPTARFETGGYGAAIRDDKFWTWETEAVGRGGVGRRDRYGIEGHYIGGPCALSSEYLVAQYNDIEVFAVDGTRVIDEDGDVSSWSTWASIFLTGEQKQVGNFGWKQPGPKNNFDPKRFSGSGSWEILARYTATAADENLFRSVTHDGAVYRILKGSHETDEYTVGVSWGWNPLLRWQLNYTYISCDKRYGGILTGDKENVDGYAMVRIDQMIGLRLIFKF